MREFLLQGQKVHVQRIPGRASQFATATLEELVGDAVAGRLRQVIATSPFRPKNKGNNL